MLLTRAMLYQLSSEAIHGGREVVNLVQSVHVRNGQTNIYLFRVLIVLYIHYSIMNFFVVVRKGLSEVSSRQQVVRLAWLHPFFFLFVSK